MAPCPIPKDGSHRLWNDTWGALSSSGLKALFVVLIVVLNCDHGPWGDNRFYQTAVESCKAYLTVGSPDDCLFQRCFGRIVRQMGLEGRRGDPDLPAEVFRSIQDSVTCMTEKVAQSRWFGVFASLEKFWPLWSRRYLLLAYIGLELGTYSSAGRSLLKGKQGTPPVSLVHAGLQ